MDRSSPKKPELVIILVCIEDRLESTFEALQSRLKNYDLPMWLFIFALAIYLVTRLIGLTQFPIYFFTDEAIQSQSIIDLMDSNYQVDGVWFPTYFRNGEYYNLSTSVYMQWLPSMLFGTSAVVTRATSVFITLIAAISVGLILRHIFKMKYWWAGTLFLSITPAWFLHSRTAFETAEFVAFYAGALCAYLFYRDKSPRYLYVAIFLGALAFYTYGPAQLIVPLTAIGLLISDRRYHWENRETVVKGLALGVFLTLPYIRFSMNNSDAPLAHLHTLWSYWFEEISLSEKIIRYLSELGIGLTPWYWYIPNNRDLPRHLMKDYGNIMIATLPFALIGMTHILQNLRLSAHRAILIALLVSPSAAALVQISITRTLAFVVPVTIFTTIGLEQVLQWIEDPKGRIIELKLGSGPTIRRVAAASFILLLGMPIAFISTENINRVALSALAIFLAIQVSGVFEWLIQSLTRPSRLTYRTGWKPMRVILALTVFVLLSRVNISILNDALKNGALWYRDYGIGGMQYGAFQIFPLIEEYVQEHPETRIIFSPDWANGTDVIARFFLEEPLPIQIGSVQGHMTRKLSLDENTLFVMTPQEYDIVTESTKFKDVRVETIIPFPDGSPGFYFVRLRYVDNIDQIFAAEKAARQILQESTVTMDGQEVKLRFSYLESALQAESVALVFDDDPFTLAKTYDNNPFVIEMTFPSPRILNGFSIIIGSINTHITLKCYPKPGAEPIVYTFEGQGTLDQPELSFDLPTPTQVQVLQVEVLDSFASEVSQVHIWELKLR